jgi:uncharacterized protein (TIGR00730 family)
LRSVCVFCGSNTGARTAYAEAAQAVGRAIATRGLDLVYGGAGLGLMGALADAALAAGGRVVGIIPGALVEREIAHPGLSELHQVNSMHERKAMMADRADAFLALPGGAGTMEEVFEVWTWAQLGHHRKPVGFLNVEGFFNALLAFLDHQVAERFIRSEHREMLIVDREPESLLRRFEEYRPPTVTKWIGRSER